MDEVYATWASARRERDLAAVGRPVRIPVNCSERYEVTTATGASTSSKRQDKCKENRRGGHEVFFSHASIVPLVLKISLDIRSGSRRRSLFNLTALLSPVRDRDRG
jgi:hypothetical protein